MKLFAWGLIIGMHATCFVYADDSLTSTAAEHLSRKEVNGKAVFKAIDLTLLPNETLILEEPAKIFVDKLEMDTSSKIDTQGHPVEIFVGDQMNADQGVVDVSFENSQDTSGANGENGIAGVKAIDALKGGKGGDGGHGSHGVNGGDGAPISIITPYLRGNVTLVTRGGDGGRGGNGGSAGNGGKGLGGSDARTLYYFKYLDGQSPQQLLQLASMLSVPYAGQALLILMIFNGTRIGDGFDGYNGGDGGAGGNGGNGGSGGNGGDISLVFGQQIEGTKIYINTRGGRGGTGGAAGVGGVGGDGGEGGRRGDIWAREGKPGKAGKTGLVGIQGAAGSAGKSGKVKAVETNDPKWIGCYVRYRELVEFGEDQEFAREVLRNCSR